MYCIHCGKQISDNAAFCGYCGGKMEQEPRQSAKSQPTCRNRKSVKIAVVISAILVLASAVMLLFYFRPWAERPITVAELLDLGEKYLLDMNYEQALMHFLEVIEIEPKEPRGYTGASDAYIGLGDLDNAISILERGLRALPENADIQNILDELQPPVINEAPILEPTPEPLSESIEGGSSDVELSSVFESYLRELREKTDSYGIGYTGSYGEFTGYSVPITFEGVIYAELVDFDNNAIPEMLVVWNDTTVPFGEIVTVYGYSSGILQHFEARMITEGGTFARFEIATSADGQKYFIYHDGYFGGDDFSLITYLTVVENTWTTMLSLSHEHVLWDDQQHWTVNNNMVTEETYAAAPELELGIVEVRDIPYLEWNEDGTFAPLTDTVVSVLAELEGN